MSIALSVDDDESPQYCETWATSTATMSIRGCRRASAFAWAARCPVAAGWLALFGVGCAPLGVGAVVFGGLAWRELRASSDQLGRRRAGFGIIVGSLEVVVVAVLVARALR